MQHFLPHIFSETEAAPQTKIFGNHWGGRPHPVVGLNSATPLPGKSNTGSQTWGLRTARGPQKNIICGSVTYLD